MDSERIQTILETSPQYDETRDNTLRAMINEFYTRKMSSIVALVWGMGLIFMGLAAFCAVRFFYATDTRGQIFHAVGFLLFMQWLASIKIFAWQMIHRNSIKREIKRLEIRLQDISERIGS